MVIIKDQYLPVQHRTRNTLQQQWLRHNTDFHLLSVLIIIQRFSVTPLKRFKPHLPGLPSTHRRIISVTQKALPVCVL
jgi:hypothetical protein